MFGIVHGFSYISAQRPAPLPCRHGSCGAGPPLPALRCPAPLPTRLHTAAAAGKVGGRGGGGGGRWRWRRSRWGCPRAPPRQNPPPLPWRRPPAPGRLPRGLAPPPPPPSPGRLLPAVRRSPQSPLPSQAAASMVRGARYSRCGPARPSQRPPAAAATAAMGPGTGGGRRRAAAHRDGGGPGLGPGPGRCLAALCGSPRRFTAGGEAPYLRAGGGHEGGAPLQRPGLGVLGGGGGAPRAKAGFCARCGLVALSAVFALARGRRRRVYFAGSRNVLVPAPFPCEEW